MYIMSGNPETEYERRLRERLEEEERQRRAANLDILRREEELNQALLEVDQRIEEPMEFEEPMEEGPIEIALREDAVRREANLDILLREEEERNQQNQQNQALLEIEPRNEAPMEGGKRKKSKKAKKAKKAKKSKKGKKAKKTKNLRRHAVKKTRRHRR